MSIYGDDSAKAVSEDSLSESDTNGGLISNNSGLHPIRPYADDCIHYRRTGSCKFALSCKYNHPPKRTLPVRKDNDLDEELNLDNPESKIECKYYMTGQPCKYGESCRYNHFKLLSDVPHPPPELNSYGLPIRMGEKICPFYERKGVCGYGANCFYNHPEPTSPSISYLVPEDLEEEIMDDSESDPEPSIPNEERDPLEYGVYLWKGNKRYFHKVPLQDPCEVNDVGLPLRPGKKICWTYDKFRLCKGGRTCPFDHPAKCDSP